MTRASLLNDIEMHVGYEISHNSEVLFGMVPLTVIAPIIFCISLWVRSNEHNGGKASHAKSQSGRKECWFRVLV